MVNNLAVGNRLDGFIRNVADFGVFVNLTKHQKGLVHKSDFTDFESEKDTFEAGQKIRVVIIKITDNKIDLSIARLHDPELIDPANPFNETDPEKFSETLVDSLHDLNDQITKISEKNNDL